MTRQVGLALPSPRNDEWCGYLENLGVPDVQAGGQAAGGVVAGGGGEAAPAAPPAAEQAPRPPPAGDAAAGGGQVLGGQTGSGQVADAGPGGAAAGGQTRPNQATTLATRTAPEPPSFGKAVFTPEDGEVFSVLISTGVVAHRSPREVKRLVNHFLLAQLICRAAKTDLSVDGRRCKLLVWTALCCLYPDAMRAFVKVRPRG
jgi:hypothetical protein